MSRWKELAVFSYRQDDLRVRLRSLLDAEVDADDVKIDGDTSQVILEGVIFKTTGVTGELMVVAPCPRCHKPQTTPAIQSLSDVGRAVDGLCKDCLFLINSGLTAPAQRVASSQR